ncbi:MAG: hypothetical protein CVV41_11565 [Candidatus Riflebacteria bacterium HGW-Riflebacteria-1]|jgi:hypothetical protein|nr:MAG: hypothetical protein CVV41_11565 [Candidatus Riflebacteria bacterium HGW-Riflebacteria-1]
MKINNLNTILAIVLFTSVLMISGFNNPQIEYFPAPLASPQLSLYANLTASGLYDTGESALNASQEIVSHVENLCVARGADKTTSHHIRTAAENLLNDRLLNGQIKVYELFFYFADQQNFAIILRGEFARQRLAGVLGAGKVVDASDKSVARFRSPLNPSELIFMQVGSDEIVICPDNISGNVTEKLAARQNILGSEFAAFAKMIRVRPAVAAEINLAALQSAAAKESVPDWFKALRHTRLIVSSQMAKMQLFIPDADERARLLRQVEGLVGGLREHAGNLVDFSAAASGNSIFIEAPAGDELERLVSSRSIAFLMHFFVRAQKNQLMVSSRDADDNRE